MQRSIRSWLFGGLVTVALVVGVAPSPVQVAYRLTATYAVKGTQIIGLNITSDAAIEAQAVHFIDAGVRVRTGAGDGGAVPREYSAVLTRHSCRWSR